MDNCSRQRAFQEHQPPAGTIAQGKQLSLTSLAFRAQKAGRTSSPPKADLCSSHCVTRKGLWALCASPRRAEWGYTRQETDAALAGGSEEQASPAFPRSPSSSTVVFHRFIWQRVLPLQPFQLEILKEDTWVLLTSCYVFSGFADLFFVCFSSTVLFIIFPK